MSPRDALVLILVLYLSLELRKPFSSRRSARLIASALWTPFDVCNLRSGKQRRLTITSTRYHPVRRRPMANLHRTGRVRVLAHANNTSRSFWHQVTRFLRPSRRIQPSRLSSRLMHSWGREGGWRMAETVGTWNLEPSCDTKCFHGTPLFRLHPTMY